MLDITRCTGLASITVKSCVSQVFSSNEQTAPRVPIDTLGTFHVELFKLRRLTYIISIAFASPV